MVYRLKSIMILDDSRTHTRKMVIAHEVKNTICEKIDY